MGPNDDTIESRDIVFGQVTLHFVASEFEMRKTMTQTNMILTSAQSTRLLVVISFLLACWANYKLQIHIQSQKNLSRLVVEQIQKAFDAVAVLDRKVSAAHNFGFSSEAATLEEKPHVVKDAWSFASTWIAFVQNSKDRFSSVLDAQKAVTHDDSLDKILGPLVESDERVRLALIWSETSNSEQRQAIQLVIMKPIEEEIVPEAIAPVVAVQIEIAAEPHPETIPEPHPETIPEPVAINEPKPNDSPKKRRKPATKKPDLVI